MIFIHGLGGGSRKTWSKDIAPRIFWPKEWLSRDTEFERIRVHSFGYNADWKERTSSILNIHDFANALLSSLQGSPLIRRNKEVSKHVTLCHPRIVLTVQVTHYIRMP
jgi:hypothetical protein